MRDLNFQLRELCRRNRDGSFATREARREILNLAANQLHTLGYQGLKANGLKPKHVDALIALWKRESVSDATIKNRLCHIRWWAIKIEKPFIVPPDNDSLEIDSRLFVSNDNKAIDLTTEALDRVPDIFIRTSLELQRAFGLRREEAIKFQPAYADQFDYILLKGSWCKGGRSRTIPVRNQYQRELLNRTRMLVGFGSLIPKELQYIQQLKRYENICSQVGLHKMHGLRHAYAQERYEELVGWKAPAVGGPTYKQLTDEQRKKDRLARLLISDEMGHHREQVTAIYLGR